MFKKKFWILGLSLLLVSFLFVSCGPPTEPPLPGEWEHKMHYPQLPEVENGFSVFATINAAIPYYLADDWQCSESGLVTGIHFWGHWNGSIGAITSFDIAIAKKINTCDVGEILWQQNFPINEISVSGYTEATPSGWCEPFGAYSDNVGEGYWQYDIEDIEEPFCQEEGEEYWLIIGAYVNSSLEGIWGWRNTESVHFGCTAMYGHGIISGENWWPFNSPPDYNQPLDMAFVITGGEPCEPEVCACLYSGMDGMEMLLDENWDGNNPDAGSWVPVNVIPQGDANASDWGVRFPDLPWSFMYDSCAYWVYGNNDWNSPVSYDHEYYRLPFTVPINGNCVWVRFQAYIDDGAKFYIDGPGFNGPTLFYKHYANVSMYNHDPVEFLVDPSVPVPICLGPGNYTIYIDHLDTAGVIYGLIFTAECISCQCPCQYESREWYVGDCDDFNLPTEATSPSQALLDWIAADYGNSDTIDCDEDLGNRYWAHTFTGLEPPDGCQIVSAALEITVKNNHYNDHLKIGCINNNNDTWEVNNTLWYFGVGVGGIGAITLDLSDVYDDGTTNLLGIIESEGFLDVAVDDDSLVDCAILHVTYGP